MQDEYSRIKESDDKYLKENGLTLEDVSLYIDKDTFSNDHVRVVLKGADIYGVSSNAPSIDLDEDAKSAGGL